MQHLFYSQDGAISALTVDTHFLTSQISPFSEHALKQYLTHNCVTFMSVGIHLSHTTSFIQVSNSD